MRIIALVAPIAVGDRPAYPDLHQSAASMMANPIGAIAINRASGVAHARSGFSVSAETGRFLDRTGQRAWDQHIVPVS